MRLILSALTLIAAIGLLPGCSSQQTYAAGQSWQRTECNKITDTQDRNRCMANANRSYDDYQRQTEAIKPVK